MFERLIVYSFMLLVWACSIGAVQLVSEPELEVYRDKVSKMSNGKLGLDPFVKLNFVDDIPTDNPDYFTLGTCSHIIKKVDINKKQWYKLSERKKILLIAHELDHCEYNSNHTNTLDKNNCPTSYMHETSASSRCVMKNWNKFVKEMKR